MRRWKAILCADSAEYGVLMLQARPRAHLLGLQMHRDQRHNDASLEARSGTCRAHISTPVIQLLAYTVHRSSPRKSDAVMDRQRAAECQGVGRSGSTPRVQGGQRNHGSREQCNCRLSV